MGRPKWQEEMQAAADATGKMFSVGLRPGKEFSWWAHCDGVEWDGSTPQMAVKSVVDSLNRRAHAEAHDLRRKAEAQAKVAEALDRLGVV